MISTIIAGGLHGVEACLVEVEVDISTGLPGFCMVGSLGGEVKEARERVQVALKNTGIELPPRKITVNLAPANIRKEGTAYDLPIAVGVMTSSGYLKQEHTEGVLFVGELGLDGEIKGVRGVLPIVREAARQGIHTCIVPAENALEGAMIPGIKVRGAESFGQLLRFLKSGEEEKDLVLPVTEVDGEEYLRIKGGMDGLDFAEVCGQEGAKRAAEIAAAGFHSLLMIGPPGTGKSMIAKRIPGILPPLTMEESLEVSSIYSVAGKLTGQVPLIVSRPFQNPHHTITQAALTGGTSLARPGMVSLAHRGVLFLDELPEFDRAVLDSLRQPLEDHEIHLARMHGSVIYPADFMLVCAMNPCPCGYFPDRNRCSCSENQIRRYLGRVSGPILDRIDLCVEILPLNISRYTGGGGESSADIRRRVLAARKRQEERFKQSPEGRFDGQPGEERIGERSQGGGNFLRYRFNAEIREKDMERYCPLGEKQRRLMEKAYDAMGLSARGYHRTLRVARTIADLADEERILEEHLMEALSFRMADKAYWGRRGDLETTGL